MLETMIGVDLAKSVFQVHGASMTGVVKFRKRLTRSQFRRFLAAEPRTVFVMEACGSAHYWAREMVKTGHEVKLIAPQYVRPFVRRQKNDAADAEAIVIAAQRPEMTFVGTKDEDQQASAVLFRSRERLIQQRTVAVNALRSILYEFGHVVPSGIRNIRRIEEILADENSDLPSLVRSECLDIIAQIREQTARIEAKTKTAKELASKDRPSDSARCRNLCSRNVDIQGRSKLCRLARARPAPVFVGRPRKARPHLQGRTSGHTAALDCRCHVTFELDGQEDGA